MTFYRREIKFGDEWFTRTNFEFLCMAFLQFLL